MALKVTNRKFYKYIYLKLIRQKGTAHSVALSVAIGIFFGFLIPVCQMFLAIFVAWLFKVNKIVAAACTWVTNPVTIPIVFPFNVYLGSFFIKSKVSKEEIVEIMSNITLSEAFQLGAKLGLDGFLMFVIGGSILGATLAPIAYSFVYFTVKKNNERKIERSLRKKVKREKKLQEKLRKEKENNHKDQSNDSKLKSSLPVSEQ